MKLAVSFTVACLLVSAYANSIPAETVGSGPQWKYLYEGQVLTGIPTLDHQYAGLGMKFEVFINKLDYQDRYLMRIADVKTAQINQKVEQGRGLFKHLLKLNYEQDPLMATQLITPVHYEQVNGIVTKIMLHSNETYWSMNVKKALLSMFSKNDTLIREEQQKQQAPVQYTRMYRPRYTSARDVMERGLEGNCSTLYEVYPVGSGPLSRAELYKVRQAQQNTKRPILQVTKLRKLDECYNRNIIVESEPTVTFCKNCGSKQQGKFAESSKMFYILDPVSKNVEEAINEAETIIPKMGKHTAVASITQRMKLLREHAQAEYRVTISNGEWQDFESTRYSIATSLKEILYNENDSDEGMTVSNGYRAAESHDFFLQQRAIVGQVLTLTDSEIQKVYSLVENGIKELTRDIVSDKTSTSKPTASVSIWNVAKAMSHLPEKKLYELYVRLSEDSSKLPEEKQVQRKLFLDTLVMAGSTDSVKIFKRLVEGSKIQTAEAVELATGFQESVSIPVIAYIRELIELCHSENVRREHLLHSAACISVGEVIHRTCMSSDHVQMSNKTLVNRICKPYNLENFIRQLAQNLDSSPVQQRAVYLQALASSGTVYALEHVKKYIVDMKQPEVLRTSALMALKSITLHHPELVLDIVLPIYNNRQETEIVRIAASSILFASRPSYAVLEKIAVNLARETDNQVGSFVYTTMHTLANATSPLLYPLAVNVSKAVKLATPFKLDRTSSYRKIVTLWDITKHVNLMFDNKYVSSKSTGLPKYASTEYSVTSPGNVVNRIIEARMLLNGLEKQILEKILPSQTALEELPEYYKNIIEKLRLRMETPEKKEGEAFVRLYERTLYAYVSEDNSDAMYQQLRRTAQQIQDKLRANVTTTYVKAMLPLRSGFIIPSQTGLPLTYFQTNEVVFALRLKDIQLKVEPKLTFDAEQQMPQYAKFSGIIKPFVRISHAHVIGLYNPAQLKFFFAGKHIRFMMNAPVTVKMQYSKPEGRLRTVLKPHYNNIFLNQVSYPFTAIFQGQTMKPCYDQAGVLVIKINNHPIRYDKVFGKELVGIGFKVMAVSENPWSMHSLAYLKKMENPFQQLPGTLHKLVLNPWLASREVTLKLEEGSTTEIETIIKKESVRETMVAVNKIYQEQNQQRSQQPTQEQQEQQLWQQEHQQWQLEHQQWQREGEKYEYNLHKKYYVFSAIVNLNGTSHRQVKTQVAVGSDETNKWFLIDSKFTRHAPQSKYLRVIVEGKDREVELMGQPADDINRFVRREFRVRYSTEPHSYPEKEVLIRGDIHERLQRIESLVQPEKSLVAELKKRCLVESEQIITQSAQHVQISSEKSYLHLSRECIEAIKNKAVIKTAEYELLDRLPQTVVRNLTAPLAYIQYLLYPYMQIHPTKPNYISYSVPRKMFFRTIQGLDVTSFSLVNASTTWNFTHVHHESRIVNKLISMPAQLDLHPLRHLQTEYFMPVRGVCTITGSEVSTFDGVRYPFLHPNCEYIVAQDKSPAQQFLAIVSKSSLNVNAKVLKLLAGVKDIEVHPPTSSYWTKEQVPVVKVNGQPISLSSQQPRFSIPLRSGDQSRLLIKYRPHKFELRHVVELSIPKLGLTIDTDGYSVIVKAPRWSRGLMEGLCGDNNGEQTAEFVGPDQCEYANSEDFVKSYQIPSAQCPAPVLSSPLQCYTRRM